MVIMLIFVLIVLLEMLVSAFRGTKTNIARLVCNIVSVLIAGGITFLISKIFTKTFTDLTSFDLTFNGVLADGTADKLDIILSAFAEGVALSVLFSVLYLIIKLISILITKIVVKDESKKGFKPVGLIFGLVIGLICAGFVLMPFTGLQQIFPDKESAVLVSDLVFENAGNPAGAITNILVGPEAERVSRYTGIGLITNKVFNNLTTAKTDSGEECLADFLPPYIDKIDDVLELADEDNLLSDKTIAAANALDAFSETKLFTEKEKVTVIEDAIKDTLSDLDEFPEYKSISAMSADLAYAGDIVKIFENTLPADARRDLLDNLDLDSLNLSDNDIEKLADDLYSMNAGEFYVNYIMSLMLQSDDSKFSGNDFASTKPAFISMVKTAMNLKNVISTGEIDEDTFKDNIDELLDSGLISDEDIEEIINKIKDDPAAADIPDEVFEEYLNRIR